MAPGTTHWAAATATTPWAAATATTFCPAALGTMASAVVPATTCSPAGRLATASVAVPVTTWRPTSPRHRVTPATARSPGPPRAGASGRRGAPADQRATATGPLTWVALGQDVGIGSAVVFVVPRRARVLGGCAPAPRHAGPGRGRHASRAGRPQPPARGSSAARNLNRHSRRSALRPGLQQQREHAKAAAAQPSPAPEPEPRRPSRRWLLVTGLLVAVALVGGIFVGAVAWSTDQPAGAKAGSPGSPPRPRAPTPPALVRWPRRRVRRRSTGPTRCSPAPSGCGGGWPVQQDHERPVHSQPLRPRGGREDGSGAAGRGQRVDQVRPGPWPTTGRSWTSASSARHEPDAQVRS